MTRLHAEGRVIDEFSEPRLVAVYETINDYELGTQPDFCRELATDIDAKTIVDIGCGTGLITRELARLGYRMIGVDPEAARIDTKTVFLGIDDDIVWFKNDSFFAGTGELVVSQAKLRFRTLDELTGTLADAGFAIDRLYGDWGHRPLHTTSPELIVVAVRG